MFDRLTRSRRRRLLVAQLLHGTTVAFGSGLDNNRRLRLRVKRGSYLFFLDATAAGSSQWASFAQSRQCTDRRLQEPSTVRAIRPPDARHSPPRAKCRAAPRNNSRRLCCSFVFSFMVLYSGCCGENTFTLRAFGSSTKTRPPRSTATSANTSLARMPNCSGPATTQTNSPPLS